MPSHKVPLPDKSTLVITRYTEQNRQRIVVDIQRTKEMIDQIHNDRDALCEEIRTTMRSIENQLSQDQLVLQNLQQQIISEAFNLLL